MSIPEVPKFTRLRWVTAREPDTLERFLLVIRQRVEIKSISFAKGKWYCWFIPGDTEEDISSGDLDGVLK